MGVPLYGRNGLGPSGDYCVPSGHHGPVRHDS